MGRGEPGRQRELPRPASCLRLIWPGLGFLPHAGPGDGGLARVALHTSVSPLFPHTLTERLFGGQAPGWAPGGHREEMYPCIQRKEPCMEMIPRCSCAHSHPESCARVVVCVCACVHAVCVYVCVFLSM